MDTKGFWTLIDNARRGARDDDAFLGRLHDALELLSRRDLLGFEHILHRFHSESFSYPLWGAAHLVLGGCSDGAFDDFRAGLISMGERCFGEIVGEPDRLALLEEPPPLLEELLYVACDIYSNQTGEELPDSVYEDVVRPPTSEAWDFSDPVEMQRRYPRCFARFEKPRLN